MKEMKASFKSKRDTPNFPMLTGLGWGKKTFQAGRRQLPVIPSFCVSPCADSRHHFQRLFNLFETI